MQSFDEKHSASKKKINKNVITIQAEYKKLKEIYVIVQFKTKSLPRVSHRHIRPTKSHGVIYNKGNHKPNLSNINSYLTRSNFFFFLSHETLSTCKS